jgi:hypothetical protein
MPRPNRRGPERRERDETRPLMAMTHRELVHVAYFGGLLKDHGFVFRSTLEQRLEAARILRERRLD